MLGDTKPIPFNHNQRKFKHAFELHSACMHAIENARNQREKERQKTTNYTVHNPPQLTTKNTKLNIHLIINRVKNIKQSNHMKN